MSKDEEDEQSQEKIKGAFYNISHLNSLIEQSAGPGKWCPASGYSDGSNRRLDTNGRPYFIPKGMGNVVAQGMASRAPARQLTPKQVQQRHEEQVRSAELL